MDTQSAAANQNLGALRQLSELPLQIVQTQIRAATTLGQNGTQSVNTWTSQPGLLRVYSNAGEFVSAYKLYSSSELETDSLDFIGNEISDKWPENPNRWVNLNAPFLASASGNRTLWPILNPNAVHWAEGLEIQPDPAGDARATMPVEWLYVLEDGSVVAQDAITKGNPPVGRVAFWTDDESCKININTAGERTMWDRPRAWHEKREIYGQNQPSTGEYNAYPGHPATVSLSAVFGKALRDENGNSDNNNKIVQTMLTLSPRYRWGGSENASRSIWNREADWTKGSVTNINKNERLYATPSEFLLNVSRGISDPRLKTPIQESGFLLTESSRAPEMNAFGLPRIGIWPIDVSENKRTAYDDLIARCLTIGNKPYYFQRSDPLANDEAESIPRNGELMIYLDALTKKEINGFGGNFEDKWGQDERRQILTEIFDYVRAATNLSDTSRDESEYSLQFTPATKKQRGFVIPTKISVWNTRGLGRAPVLTHAAIVFYAYEQHNLESNPTLPKKFKTQVRAVLWFNFFTATYGLAPFSTSYGVRVVQAPMAIKAPEEENFHPLILIGSTATNFLFPRNNQDFDWGGYNGMLLHEGSITGTSLSDAKYPLQSAASVEILGDHMDFQGGRFEIQLLDNTTGDVLQTYHMDFPGSDLNAPWPVPLLWAGVNGDPDHHVGYNPLHFSGRRYEKPLDADQLNNEGNRAVSNLILGRRHPSKPPVDVIRTVELRDGDARIVSALEEVDESFFMPGYGYSDGSRWLTGSLLTVRGDLVRNTSGTRIDNDGAPGGNDSQFGRHVNLLLKMKEYPTLPRLWEGENLLSLRGAGWAGDFDNGFLGESDGPYANKPDEGHTIKEGTDKGLPYYSTSTEFVAGPNGTIRFRSWDPRVNGFFSPTRQTPSAIMFGSLPTTVKRTQSAYLAGQPKKVRPWETLRFSPNTSADMEPDGKGVFGHPGAASPKDHLLLDLFTMPVVEPYAISEPFSTAGKVNINQRIVPFTHLKRETGLHGVLKNLEMTAIPNSGTSPSPYRSGSTAVQAIREVDVDATLGEIGKILDPGNETGKGIFRGASEICDIFLIPKDRDFKNAVNWSTNNPASFWQGHKLTGDNSREAPYNYIYPLLTTKSNTYQIHYRVQTLKPLRQKTDYDAKEDFAITGEQRGSYVIERYLDVNDPALQAVDTDATSLNDFYHFRTLRHDRFAPSL